jgi:hypothetical protein
MINFQDVNIKILHLKIASVSYLGGIGIFLYIFMSNKIIVYYNDVYTRHFHWKKLKKN